MQKLLIGMLGLWQVWSLPLHTGTRRRDQRGLSQSAENAILLAGAVTVAGIVIAAVTIYVRSHLPR